jgi:hypothetical protein
VDNFDSRESDQHKGLAMELREFEEEGNYEEF